MVAFSLGRPFLTLDLQIANSDWQLEMHQNVHHQRYYLESNVEKDHLSVASPHCDSTIMDRGKAKL